MKGWEHLNRRGLMWKYREPSPEDYDSDEEYQDALDAYDAAESLYEDKCMERYYEEKYG